MSIAVASGIALVIVAIIAIPILISVLRSAGGERNPNRAESEEDRERQEAESGEQNR